MAGQYARTLFKAEDDYTRTFLSYNLKIFKEASPVVGGDDHLDEVVMHPHMSQEHDHVVVDIFVPGLSFLKEDVVAQLP